MIRRVSFNKKSFSFLAASLIVIIAIIIFAKNARISHTKEDYVFNTMRAIDGAIERYKEDYGRLPQSLEELLRPESNGRYFGNDRFMRDRWSNLFMYKISGPDEYMLYSLGHNGIDENGAGDDIGITGSVKLGSDSN